MNTARLAFFKFVPGRICPQLMQFGRSEAHCIQWSNGFPAAAGGQIQRRRRSQTHGESGSEAGSTWLQNSLDSAIFGLRAALLATGLPFPAPHAHPEGFVEKYININILELFAKHK